MELNQGSTNQTEINQVKTKKLNPLYGIITFIIVIVVMIFGAFPLQYKWGMTGLILTELILLLIAILATIISRQNIREIFPFKKPRLRQVFGTFFLWLGSFMVVIPITVILTFFLPQEITQVSDQMADFFTSVPGVLTFFVVAIMPAICEEALHRGFIYKTFSGLKNKWAIIAIMGIIFGIFHLDPFRFLPTAILGVAITYAMVETQNLFYPMLLHFINNSVSVSSLLLTQKMQSLEFFQAYQPSQTELAEQLAGAMGPGIMLVTIGQVIILAAAAPLLLKLASSLFKAKVQITEASIPGEDVPVTEEEIQAAKEVRQAERAKRNKSWIIALVYTIAISVVGVVIFSIGMVNTMASQGLF